MATIVQEALETPATSANDWKTKAPMPLARSYAASGVIDGKIYSVGGGGHGPATDPDERSNINLCYDPASDRWEEKAPMPTPRHNAGGAVVRGKLHVVGGSGLHKQHFLTTHQVYDPGTDRWLNLPDLPVGRALVKTAVVNDRIYALGGSKRQRKGAGPCQDHTVYDPAFPYRWSAAHDIPEPKMYHAVTAIGSKIYVFGGQERSPNNFVYDTATRTWSRIAPCPQLVGDAGVATLGGKIYLVGGTTDGCLGTPLTLVQVYDPAKDTWEKLPAPLPHPRQALVAAGVGGTLYAIGGLFDRKTCNFNTALEVNTGGMRRIGAANISWAPPYAAVMEPGTDYAFLGLATAGTGSVVKVKLGDSSKPPTFVGEVKIPDPGASFYSGVMARGFAYFGNVDSYVVQIAPGTGDDPPTLAGCLQLAADEKYLTSAVVDAANGYAYFGTTKDWPGHIVKVKLGSAGPKRIGGFPFSGAIFAHCAAIDVANGFAYFGTYDSRIVKVALGAGDNPPTQQGLLNLDPADGHLVSAVLDPLRGFAYFGTDSTPGRVIQVRLSDFQRVNTLTLERGEDKLACAVIDAVKGYAYFGTATGRVVKVSLGDGTPVRVGSLKLEPEETELRCAVIDTARGFACFGTAPRGPSRFVKVTLGD